MNNQIIVSILPNPRVRAPFLLLLLLLLINSLTNVSGATSRADRQFEQLLDQHWQSNLARFPTFATSLGVRDYDNELQDLSLEAYSAQIEQSKEFLEKLNKIKVSKLSESHQLNHALLSLDLEGDIEAAEYGGRYMILTNRGGPHLNLTNMIGRLPFFSETDYRSYVNRLGAIPEYLSRAKARIREGLDAGWSQPCEPMQGYEKSIEAHIVDNIADSTFLQPFAKRPKNIDQGKFDALNQQAKTLVASKVIPAFKSYLDFYLAEYQPKCRSEVGTSSMEGGSDYYDYLVRAYTTTDMSAKEVHELGLSEVSRIRAEMDDVIKEAKFAGDFPAWLEYLKSNPDFYPKTPEERMTAVAVISKKMDAALPALFGRLPRMPYGLKEIPADIAEKTTTAYYQRPAGDGTRAGYYFVNTSKLDTRPLYQLEALSLHEAVPGHHLQLALAQELDLPNFRKFGGQTVFVEGWGLYAERLGLEMGFYQTPYTNFGRLSYEMWRACRLVVDTGIHAFGWTRQKAIDFMAENSGLSMNNIVSEVDRYITWPGQALAYKIGELKIRELRARAEAAMGKKFDVRAFHDKVLENGALPLSVLEKIVDEWIAMETSSH